MARRDESSDPSWSQFDAPSAREGAALPERIGEYRIVREIGRGGMGVVFEAEQTSMQRRVALKVLSLAATASPNAVKRFEREARAAGRLHHTNIVPVYGMGQDAGYWYYAMELIPGRSLGRAIAELRDRGAGAATPSASDDLGPGADAARHRRLARRFAGVADALELAHSEGIVHRDVKPSNLLVDADGEFKVVDFGLARVDDGTPAFTVTRGILGTPVYMSPEQALGDRDAIDHRTDVYSLGATLYEALTLRPPFSGKGVAEICAQIANEDPVPPPRVDPRIEADLATIVAKAMEKKPARRYATAGDLAADLRRFAEGAPIEARPIGPVGRLWRRARRHRVASTLVAAIALLAVAGGAFAWRAERESRRRRDLEYGRLDARAEEAMARAVGAAALPDLLGGDGSAPGDGSAAEAFAAMIALDPGRPGAYVGRALAPGRTIEDRLLDLREAESRGLAAGAARAYVLAAAGRPSETGGAGGPAATPEEACFLGALLASRGEREAARAALDRAVDGTARGGWVHLLALRARAGLLAEEGDLAGALRDLYVVQAAGGAGVDVRLCIAALWERLGNAETAERLFARLLEEARTAGSAEAWAALHRACRRAGHEAWHARAAEAAAAPAPSVSPVR